MPDIPPPILIAAYGNDMAGDDSFGPLVAEAVSAMALVGVEVVNLGMKPASLLDHLLTASCEQRGSPIFVDTKTGTVPRRGVRGRCRPLRRRAGGHIDRRRLLRSRPADPGAR